MRCRQAVLEGANSLLVLVDNQAAKENVSRFLASQGFTIHCEEQGPLIALHADRSQNTGSGKPMVLDSPPASPFQPGALDKDDTAPRKILVLLTTPIIGSGDDTLGARLMTNFLSTLPEMEPELWRVILLNGAVNLATLGNPALPHLKKLAASNVDILVCGTCLEFFGLTPRKAVGETTNMLDVVTSLQLADSVIRP